MAFSKPQTFWLLPCLCVALLLCMLSEAKVSRIKRQECQKGTYEHEGRKCCKCLAGQKLKEHCTALSQTQCEICEEGKEFQSHPSSLMTCELCTSCAHPNANLEVERQCTAYNDTICKCKANHYCPKSETTCKICIPCDVCGSEGEEVACSATSNTICNEPQDNSVAIILGTLLPLAVAAICIGIGCFFWKKRKSGSRSIETGPVDSSEVQIPLQQSVGKLRPHIPEIAEQIGWTTMKTLALQSEIPNGIIESCESKKDVVEGTIELLRVWEEKAGNNASSKLIQSLEKNGQNSTVNKVLAILRDSS